MMISNKRTVSSAVTQPRFQVLALSGGGYRGLYTAKVVADLEAEFGAPFARHFDMIAGTSVGGILALALALEIPAARIVELFERNGDKIFAKRSLTGLTRSKYSPAGLRALLEAEQLFGERLLGSCKHPVLIPSINYSTGSAVMFKTAHHESLRRDYRIPLVDVALATSAAPGFFPRHKYANSQYVDGGLFANAPGVLALHEATEFFCQPDDTIHLMSIGTMSSRVTADPRGNANGGYIEWGGGNMLKAADRLFTLAISVQEGLSCSMLDHRLGDRYLHIDDENTDKRARAVALDKTDAAAREVLLGVAEQRSKQCVSDARVQSFMNYQAPTPTFFHHKKSPR
jgi:predicted acylesterase/phospholipase RssA